MEPICSVIIPFYNKQTTITRAIQSVIDQTLESWELIIIDDCAEHRLDALNLPEDPRILKHRNSRNLGAARTRQYGLSMAKGKYVAFLDADDWWGKEFLNDCYAALQETEQADGAYVKTLVIKSDGKRELRSYCDLGLTKIWETLIQYARPWQTGGILWHKSSCGDWGNLKTNEDSWFEINSARWNKLLPIDTVAYFVDQGGEGHLSNTFNHCHVAKDNLLMFWELYKLGFSELSIKYRLILIHRIVRGHLKVLEYCGKNHYKELLISKGVLHWFFLLFGNSRLVLKSFHRVLQNSPYKIQF